MLINTLFLFLREVMPVFLLSAMLLALIPFAWVRRIVVFGGYGLGVVLYVLLLPVLDPLSHSLDDAGLEIFFFTIACVQVLLFGAGLVLLHDFNQRSVAACFLLMLALLTMSSLVNFLSFFTTLWMQEYDSQPLLMGLVIGAGLSASLAILLFFALYWVRKKLPLTLLVLPALFFSGHLAGAVNLLAQIGLVESAMAWSTQSWLSDQYAIAQILSSFLGYEATPITWQVYGYLLCLVLLLIIVIQGRQRLTKALTARGEQTQ